MNILIMNKYFYDKMFFVLNYFVSINIYDNFYGLFEYIGFATYH